MEEIKSKNDCIDSLEYYVDVTLTKQFNAMSKEEQVKSYIELLRERSYAIRKANNLQSKQDKLISVLKEKIKDLYSKPFRNFAEQDEQLLKIEAYQEILEMLKGDEDGYI